MDQKLVVLTLQELKEILSEIIIEVMNNVQLNNTPIDKRSEDKTE